VLTTLVEREVPEPTLRSLGDEVRRVFDDVVDDHAPRIDDAERDGLFTFFGEEVLNDFLLRRTCGIEFNEPNGLLLRDLSMVSLLLTTSKLRYTARAISSSNCLPVNSTWPI